MSDDTERRLHDQLFAVGTIDPPPGLADAALRQAKQRRHRGITAVAAAAAVVLAIAIAVPLSVRHRSAAPAHPTPPQRNLIVSYTTGVSKSNPGGILMVLDPKTGKYVESKLSAKSHAPFDWSTLVASPDGQHYASTDGKYVGTLSDVINGNVAGFHRLDPGRTGDTALQPQWSADSSRLLIPVLGVAAVDSSVGFRIYDVRTNALGRLIRLPSKAGKVYDWYADDTGFVGFAVGSRLDFFDLDGRLQRTVAVPGRPDFFSIISPDGRYLSLAEDLYDLRTGHTHRLRVPPGKEITVPLPIGWLDDDHYAIDWHASTGKNQNQHRVLVLSTAGKLLKSIKLPYGTPAMPKTQGKNPLVEIQLGYGADYPPHSGLRL